MFKDMREFIRKLEDEKELIHIRERLSPKFEIAALIKSFVKERNLAFCFDDVEGYETPVVGNLLGTKRRLALALGVLESEIAGKYHNSRENPIKSVVMKHGPVKEVEILKDVDIIKHIPVLTHHERDAGPYFTCAITMAKDPETGIRGIGIHRIQVKDKDTVGIFLASPPLSHFLTKAEERKQPLEIAIVIGNDPITFFSSVIWAPTGIDKLDIAGGLAGSSIEVVRCSTVDMEVPAHSEFVLEGHIIPGERQEEGPFGESTGYYLTFKNPTAKITAITHRKDPVYQALMPTTSEEAVLLDLSWEMDKLRDIQKVHPFVKRIHLSNVGLMAIVQIKKGSDEDPWRIIEKMLSNPFIKIVVVVDEDVDPYDYQDVSWAISTRVQPDKDMVIKSGEDGMIIDPSARGGRVSAEFFSTLTPKTSKVGIDATKPIREFDRYEKIGVSDGVKSKVRPIVERYLAGFSNVYRNF